MLPSAARRGNVEEDLPSLIFLFLILEGAEPGVYDIRSADPNEFLDAAFKLDETGDG